MSFMRSVNLYIAGNSKDPLLAEDKDKIIFTLSSMKLGHADIWADNFLEEAEESGNWGTWTDFKASLKKSFSDPNLTMHAVEKLETMTQGDLCADAFFQLFETYRRQAGYARPPQHPLAIPSRPRSKWTTHSRKP